MGFLKCHGLIINCGVVLERNCTFAVSLSLVKLSVAIVCLLHIYFGGLTGGCNNIFISIDPC